jgi:membrane protease YdiL (CAAX protease family)
VELDFMLGVGLLTHARELHKRWSGDQRQTRLRVLMKMTISKVPPYVFLIILLLLRFSFTLFPVLIPDRDIIDIFSIVLLSLFIYIEKDRLDMFNIVGIDIRLFIVSNILFRIFLFSSLYFVYLLCGSFILWVYIKWIKQKQQEKPAKEGWIFLSIFLGIGVPILSWQVSRHVFGTVGHVHYPGLFATIIYFLQILASTAMIEEFIVRGLLWGICRKMNLQDNVILFIQGLIFWIGHIHYLPEDGYTFWFVLPIMSLVFGLVVMKYRSITPAIIIHTLYNVSVFIFR